MGIRDAIGDRWARFRAYLHSIPPHVWLGLVIGAIALVLAYLAWKNRNNALSPLSQLTPLSDTTTTSMPGVAPGVNQIPLPAVPDLGNLVYPGGQYYNYNSQQPVKPAAPSAPASLLQTIFASATSYAPQAFAAEHAPVVTPYVAPASSYAPQAFAAEHAPVVTPYVAPASSYAPQAFAAEHAVANATHAVITQAKVPLPPTERRTNISF
jgi:hypothetical protein